MPPSDPYDPAAVPRRWLRWSDVVPRYRAACLVWSDAAELDWLEGTWRILEFARLTRYACAVTFFETWARAVALAQFYHGWCASAFGVGGGRVSAWGDALGLWPSWCAAARTTGGYVRIYDASAAIAVAPSAAIDRSWPTTEQPAPGPGGAMDDALLRSLRDLYDTDLDLAVRAAYRNLCKALRHTIGEPDAIHRYLMLSRSADFAGRVPVPRVADLWLDAGRVQALGAGEPWIHRGFPPLGRDGSAP